MLKIGTITINKRRPVIKTKIYISLIILIFSGILAINYLKSPMLVCGFPPTDKTFVKTDMEDVKEHLDKDGWLSKIHSTSPSTNWKVIEAQNSYNRYLDNRSNNSSDSKSLNNINIAEGKIVGEWIERGSNNQAGSVTRTAYDSYSQKLYVLADGGSIWKGSINGLNWEVFDDQLRFDNNFLAVINQSSSPSLILASINGIPHIYRNQEWVKSSGFSETAYLKTKNLRVINQGEEIFFLAQESSTSPVCIYYSNNYGQNFIKLRNFDTTQLNKMGIAGQENRPDLVIIEQSTNLKSKIYNWETNSDKLDLVNSSSSINFGSFGDANIQFGSNPNELFVYDSNNILLRSTDFGKNWQTFTQLPITPWSSGVFISRSNPNKLLVPNVEAYRSSNRGESWEKVNNWIEYYDNRSIKLHADITYIAEYKQGSQDFIIVANHGGLSISYDNGNNFSNIGLNNLNISQYYSVKTYPRDQRYVFAGSQDQGLQRSLLFAEGAGNFDQMFSGDFGHIQFTNNNRSLWSVFPGGLVVYYEDPLTNSFPSSSYFLSSVNKDVWLPPIIKSPYNSNSVLLAGGGKQNSNGSHIIELKVSDLGSSIQENQWPFDFSVSGGTLSHIAVNNFENRFIYAITSNGKFYKSSNNGSNFSQKSDGLSDANFLYGSKILCSSLNKDKIFVGGSGYDNSPIFMSLNNGESFASLQHNLPSTVIYDLVLNENESFLFAATEAGPYVYIFNESKWYSLGQGISPDQAFWSVEFLKQSQVVRFGTFGRGIWDLRLDHLNNLKEAEQNIQVNIYPNPTSESLYYDTQNNNIESVKILDAQGSIIMVIDKSSVQKNKIDVSDFSNGVYYIIFETKNSSEIKNFIKI